jgi:hypothetical protein
MVVLIISLNLGNGQGLGGAVFAVLFRGNVILSLLDKVYINSSTIRRHSGGIINN